jgi:hypothetical protein
VYLRSCHPGLFFFNGVEPSARKEDDSEELHLCEAEQPPSPSIELRPSGLRNVVHNGGHETTSIFLDECLEMEDPCAMDIPKIKTLESERKNSTNEHESFFFEESFSHKESLESAPLCTTCSYGAHNHLLILVYKMFRSMVVDAFVYRKHCKFCGCTMAITLQLKLQSHFFNWW